MNPIMILKGVATIGTTLSVGVVTNQAFKMLAPTAAKTATKVGYIVGCTILGTMVGEKAVEYVISEIDKVAEIFKKDEVIEPETV